MSRWLAAGGEGHHVASPGRRANFHHGLLAAGLFLAVAGLGLAELRPVAPLTVIDCSGAVTVDGALRCGGEAPATIGELCHTRDSSPIRPGDALTSAGVCDGAAARGQPGWGRMDPVALAALELPVEVNEASAEELASFRGIGPVLAGRIVAARPFASVDELRGVPGIGPKKMARLRTRARAGW